nr:MAG TPA: hypothetical protein [Bacteriophage sp.]
MRIFINFWVNNAAPSVSNNCRKLCEFGENLRYLSNSKGIKFL